MMNTRNTLGLVGANTDETIAWTTTDPICAPLPALAHAKVYTYEKATAAAPLAFSYTHSCAVGESGHAYCSGWSNTYGELGTLNVAGNRPSLVATLSNVNSPALASERLHAIKASAGLGAADNVVFDYGGNVYHPTTGEWLGGLTEGGKAK